MGEDIHIFTSSWQLCLLCRSPCIYYGTELAMEGSYDQIVVDVCHRNIDKGIYKDTLKYKGIGWFKENQIKRLKTGIFIL